MHVYGNRVRVDHKRRVFMSGQVAICTTLAAWCVKEGLLAVTCRLTSGGGEGGGWDGGGGGGNGRLQGEGVCVGWVGGGGWGVNGGREETVAHPITCNMPFSRFFLSLPYSLSCPSWFSTVDGRFKSTALSTD